MLDKRRILSKINEMESYLEELSGHIPTSSEEYMNDRDTRRICERLLQITVECTIDISSVIAKGLKLGPPADEGAIFEKLKRENVISKKMADTLLRMKGFRNILVHRYGEVDDKKVFNFLKNNINDFTVFKKEVLAFLKN
jgi:uncharacterized protein YutE (UPF0331/DUF86 family)